MPEFNEQSLTELLHDHGLVEHRYHSSAPPPQRMALDKITEQIRAELEDEIRDEYEAEAALANDAAESARLRAANLEDELHELTLERDELRSKLTPEAAK